MRSDLLHIVTCVANPLRWKSRIKTARDAIQDWVAEGANVTVVECAYGARPYELTDIPGITHIPVRARSMVWNKENLLNIGISRLPAGAHYIGVFDADIHFRKRGWAAETVHALQLYPVVQPWSDAYDLGPNDDHMASHKSFCRQFHGGFPVAPDQKKLWKFDGGPYDYPHTGYAWAWTRKALDDVGGLIEVGGMGSGDHHMALGLVGRVDLSVPAGVHPSYLATLHRWEKRAEIHINGKIGYVPGTIEHAFHGRKADRRYVPRWDMFVKHSFNPDTDLKRNTHQVIEFAGNKPELEAEFDRYLRSREEDINTL